MVSGLLAGVAGGATVAIVIKAIDKATPIFAGVNKNMLLLGGALTAVGIAGIGAIAGLTKLAGQFEQTQIAFTTMLGSAEEADKLLKELADFATKTPFTITGIEQNAKQLLAMGIEVEDLIPTLKSLGDVSAGLSVPLEQIAINFGQVKARGKLAGTELRDFTRAGVPLREELAKNLGVAISKIEEMSSAGEISFADVENAFKSMTSEGGKFFNLMDEQSKTFLGQVNNIQDSLTKLGRIMGDVFLPAATFLAEKIAIIIAFMEKHPTVTKFAAVILAVATALTLLAGVILLVTAVSGVLALIWSPITLVVLLIAAAIAILIAIGILLVKKWGDIQKAAQVLDAVFRNVMIGIHNIVIKVWNGIVDIISSSINSIINLINGLIKLLNKIPGVSIGTIGNLDFERFKGQSIDFGAIPSLNGGQNQVNNINVEGNLIGLNSDDIIKSMSDGLGNSVSL